MLSQFCFISTFGLVALICQTSLSVANHTQLNRQRHHRLARDIDLGQLQQDVENRRDDVFDITKRQVGTVTVPLADIQLLQSEITAFGQWMSAWLASQDGSTSTESISLLQQEITAYEGWMQAWLDLAGVTSASATTLLAPHTSVPLPTSVGPSSTLDRSASQHSSPTSSPVSAPSSASGGQFVQEAKTDVPTTPTTSSTRSTSSTSSAKTTATPPGVTVKTSSASTQVSSHSMVATVTSSRTASSIPTGGSSYRFNADASNNVAVYYGQTAATGQ
ncbi:hypothetical protein MMC08_002243, partial [Hypocenomyce scalaris]|nr:hypothetical protein [Hypocenomyce scalaris]